MLGCDSNDGSFAELVMVDPWATCLRWTSSAWRFQLGKIPMKPTGWSRRQKPWKESWNDVKHQFSDTPRSKNHAAVISCHSLDDFPSNLLSSNTLVFSAWPTWWDPVASSHGWQFLEPVLRKVLETHRLVLEAYFLLSLKVLKLLFWCVSSGGDEFGGFYHGRPSSRHFWEIKH